MNITQKLSAIQLELKAPKGSWNDFGKYNYRSAENILDAVKPICAKHGVTLSLTDEPLNLGERYYIKAFATIVDQVDESSKITVSASAREADVKKGMDSAQITGACSSYARKYALGGLFCLDDNKDADTNEFTEELEKAQAKEDKQVKKLQDEIYGLQVNAGVTDAQFADGFMKKYGVQYFKADEATLRTCVADMKKKARENEKQS